MRSRPSLRASENASATEIPPRRPPQVSTRHDPDGKRNTRDKAPTGSPTVSMRAARVTAIATSMAPNIAGDQVILAGPGYRTVMTMTWLGGVS